MRIDSGTLEMGSTRTYHSYTEKGNGQKIGQVGYNDQKLNGNLFGFGGNLTTGSDDGSTDTGSTQEEMGAADFAAHFRSLSNTGRVSGEKDPEDTLFTLRQKCIQFLMDLLFGPQKLRDLTSDYQMSLPSTPVVYTVRQETQQYYHKEEECTTFSTVGTVKTADGRELSFNLECSMSRSFEEFYEETHTVTEISYMDPLVINLGADVASVSDQKFFFDLDCDGEKEEVSMLKKGSTFLALDRNGDGVIGDGSELFGTKSGDGFRDLEQYDEDGNGWIDEGDPIWEKLLIWTKDDEGNDKLYHLRDLGVGAICLSRVSTEFALNSGENNKTNAMIRNTGIFLYENGTVSTVQHLDLAR